MTRAADVNHPAVGRTHCPRCKAARGVPCRSGYARQDGPYVKTHAARVAASRRKLEQLVERCCGPVETALFHHEVDANEFVAVVDIVRERLHAKTFDVTKLFKGRRAR